MIQEDKKTDLPAPAPELNYTIDKEGRIIYDGDWYYPLNQVSLRRPRITGSPKMSYEKYRFFLTRNKFTRKVGVGVIKAPKACSVYHIINYPVRKWGAFQMAFIGKFGEGKSTILSWIEANLLARKYRIFQFDDAEFEAQKLLHHGYFTKDGLFHPFRIIMWIPKGYEFNTNAENHVEVNRNNFSLREFETVEDITKELKPHVVNVVYKEAFDDASALKLLLDIIKYVKTMTTKDKYFLFVRHELADLFPESASGEMYHLVREMALEEIRKFRKRRIGMLGSLHASYDVTYTVVQKFTFLGQVRPIKHKFMTQMEKEARKYKKGQFALSDNSGYTKYTIEEFPSGHIDYLYSPNMTPWSYPDLEPILKDKNDKRKDVKGFKKTAEVIVLLQDGYSIRDIANQLNVSPDSVMTIKKVAFPLDKN